MPLPISPPALTICGLDPTKQALLDAIASKKASLIASLKDPLYAVAAMADAKSTAITDSLINKLVSNIPLIPSSYKADIILLLKDMIGSPGSPPLTSEQIQTRVNQLVTKWGQDKLDELTTLTQNFIDGQTPELCSIVNLEKVGNALPVIKPLESFPATGSSEPIEKLESTVEDKSAVPNPDRVADTVVPKTVKDNYITIIEKPISDTILNVITSFYAYLPYTGSLQNSLLKSDIDDFFNNKKNVGGITWKMIMKRIKTLNLPTAADLYKSGKASDAEKQFLTELFLASNTRQVAQNVWLNLKASQSILEKKTAGVMTPEEYSKTYSELMAERSKYLKEYNVSKQIKVDFTVTNDDFFKISYKTSSTQFSIKETVAKMEAIYSANTQLIKDYYAVKDNK